MQVYNVHSLLLIVLLTDDQEFFFLRNNIWHRAILHFFITANLLSAKVIPSVSGPKCSGKRNFRTGCQCRSCVFAFPNVPFLK